MRGGDPPVGLPARDAVAHGDPVGRIPRARVPPGLAPIYLGDQRQQFALAATDGRVHRVDRRHQMRIGMEVVPTHAATNRSGGGTKKSVSNICSLVKPFGLLVKPFGLSVTGHRPHGLAGTASRIDGRFHHEATPKVALDAQAVRLFALPTSAATGAVRRRGRRANAWAPSTPRRPLLPPQIARARTPRTAREPRRW